MNQHVSNDVIKTIITWETKGKNNESQPLVGQDVFLIELSNAFAFVTLLLIG